ncbi:hypothetical protein WS89_31115 [Burkholderia sp. MSMB1072]|nr:hypothetical protein WS89_31115 [Burkholderia sp. MSMB1072]
MIQREAVRIAGGGKNSRSSHRFSLIFIFGLDSVWIKKYEEFHGQNGLPSSYRQPLATIL